ncbi:MAG: error-prone DNA polymerase [Rhodospirillaceae bacterium]|nr:error-prone DNA polymerase [Rhodospirillaceae bacterium]
MTRSSAPHYAELQVTSNFSFLRGASHPEELVETAAALGLSAIAATDLNTLAGVVRFHAAAKRTGLKFVVGARLAFSDAPDGGDVLIYPTDRAAYGRLARLLTVGKRRAEKGRCLLTRADLFDHAEGQIAVVLPPQRIDAAFAGHVRALKSRFGARAYVAAQHMYRGNDRARIAALGALADAAGVRLVATNDVHYHVRERRALADVLTCIRAKCTIGEAGYRLAANAERHLKSPAEMARLFADRPDALEATIAIAAACGFSLDELRYEYPIAALPDGATPQDELERLAWAGAAERYPDGVHDKVAELIRYELKLIGELNYAPYFLTVHDIVGFARSRDILCQGRGSAANSAVCFALGITAVDPAKVDLLFERFVSAERGEPPDIDVDFEHERREEVIQYIYARYGRDRAGLAATVICYRPRSALRDVGKAMGLSLDAVDVLARTVWGWGREGINDGYIKDAGLNPDDPHLARTLDLARALLGFPRHLSQHVGGFVISRGPLSELVPIENAAMEDRTVIEWDKDDLDTLGMLKIDVLALGMLSCIRKGFELIARHHDRAFTLATVPAEDPAVYDMLCKGDSLGVFQVESRAQMSMLPRLRPRCWYDLVIEVAIVRPGPIQGDMVHPYLRRRQGLEHVTYPSRDLEQVLGKTLGVPLFQEQAMKIAIVAAGFTPSEADQLRRAMATFRRVGTIHSFQTKLVEGMAARGYDRAFAERCFKQIEGFGEYGFPESHAASFALLVYVSSWMKCHYPAAFACALLNAQPMGFYAPAQIVRDAREHGVNVRPVEVNASDWDNTLEPCPDATGGVALRLGFRQVKGARAADIARLLAARGSGYRDLEHIWRDTRLPVAALETLAKADVFAGLGLDRRAALWRIRALGETPLPLFAAVEDSSPGAGGHNGFAALFAEPSVILPAMTLGEQVVQDYDALRLSIRKHPLALLRPILKREGVAQNATLADLPVDRRVTVAGLVLVRQRPGTAKGVIFATLEDETGVANVIIWPHMFERFRRIVLGSLLLRVTGRLQRESGVIHVVADHVADLTGLLGRLVQIDGAPDADFDAEMFRAAIARADEVRKPGRDPREHVKSRELHMQINAAGSALRLGRPLNSDALRDVMPKGRNFH